MHELSWYWSGRYWYVHQEGDRKGKRRGVPHDRIGCGFTKTEALTELRALLQP